MQKRWIFLNRVLSSKRPLKARIVHVRLSLEASAWCVCLLGNKALYSCRKTTTLSSLPSTKVAPLEMKAFDQCICQPSDLYEFRARLCYLSCFPWNLGMDKALRIHLTTRVRFDISVNWLRSIEV